MLDKDKKIFDKLFGNLKVVKRKKDPNANLKCIRCKGYGSYSTIHCGEYEEIIMDVRRACTIKDRT